MEKEWKNWSGSIAFTPESKETPKDEEEVRQLVLKALKKGKKIRMVGAGHSSVPLVQTDHILLAQGKLKGVVGHAPSQNRVDILPGTDIKEVGQALIKLNLSMHNTGDVDMQFLGGAFGTGTHGSGKTLQNLSGIIRGCRMVDGKGNIREITEREPDLLNAAKISLGALGVFTQFTLQLNPARKYLRQEHCTHVDNCLENLDALINGNEIFDFYWYPRSDLVKLRICNPAENGVPDIPYGKFEKEASGWLYEILPQDRDLKYEEMEYILPIDAGPACFQEVRQRVKEKHRHYVGWRTLYRTIAADEIFLSPYYKQDSVSIAVLQNNELEYKSYFEDIEPIFRAYGGRPHWGKKHSLTADDLKPLYPEWEKFMEIRREFDPEGIFLNEYLNQILET